jgi:hypothetical protein
MYLTPNDRPAAHQFIHKNMLKKDFLNAKKV